MFLSNNTKQLNFSVISLAQEWESEVGDCHFNANGNPNSANQIAMVVNKLKKNSVVLCLSQNFVAHSP